MVKNKNITKYYIWRLLSGLFFTYTIQSIYILSKGLTLSDLAIFASVTAITSSILEIPTGYIADRFSRKISVSLGFICYGFAFILLIFAQNLSFLIIIGAIHGLGNALQSGSIESLLYDLLKADKNEDQYLKVSARGTSFGTITGAIASLIGPLLFVINPIIPFILNGIIFFALSIFILTIDEKRSESEIGRNISIIDGIKNIIRIKPILIITLIETVLLVIINIFYQVINFPKLSELGFPTEFLGTIDLVNLALMSLMLMFITRLVFKNEKITLIFYSILPLLIFSVYFVSSNLYIVVILSICFDLVWSARRHIIPSITNKYFSSKNRATSLSSISFFSNLFSSLLIPFTLALFYFNNLFLLFPVIMILVLALFYPSKSPLLQKEK